MPNNSASHFLAPLFLGGLKQKQDLGILNKWECFMIIVDETNHKTASTVSVVSNTWDKHLKLTIPDCLWIFEQKCAPLVATNVPVREYSRTPTPGDGSIASSGQMQSCGFKSWTLQIRGSGYAETSFCTRIEVTYSHCRDKPVDHCKVSCQTFKTQDGRPRSRLLLCPTFLLCINQI